MAARLRPGSIFAGCRLEAVAGNEGMGVVFRAIQLAVQRPVALKVIAPELAADKHYRERLKSESQLAASLHHPNVNGVYEADELDGTLYVIMPWIEGTDLRTLLTTSGRMSAGQAIGLLRPVVSALAVAHRHGLVHRNVKPANVLIARTNHVYLTDFGIAPQTNDGSITPMGTIDCMAPERIVGGEGDARADIYSLGCMLFETLTGHVPFVRPTDASNTFAYISDPIPSAREEVDGIPAQLDATIARAMAKRPEDRFGSAGQLNVALGQALQELESAERVAAAPKRGSKLTTTPVPAAPAEPAAAAAGPVAEPTAAVAEPSAPSPPQTPGGDDRRRAAPGPRRFPILWVAPIVLLVVAGVLIALLTGGSSHPGKTGATSTTSAGSAATQSKTAATSTTTATATPSTTGATSTTTAGRAATPIKITGNGLTEGRTIGLSGPPGTISVGPRNVWISLPQRGELVRFNPITGSRRILAAAGSPAAIAVGTRAVWVSDTASRSLVQFNGDTGAQVAVAKLAGSPTATALDPKDSSAWVADSSGAISHVGLGGAMIGTPAHIAPAATSLAWGEGWLWAANGSADGLVRVSLGTGGVGTSGSTTAYPGGPRPVAVAIDQGVWTANSDGHVTRFDPRPGHQRVDAEIAVAPGLDAIAATDPSAFVWAMSKRARAVYQVTNTSQPAVAGTIVFGSQPVALAVAVAAHSVWVATQDGQVTQIRF